MSLHVNRGIGPTRVQSGHRKTCELVAPGKLAVKEKAMTVTLRGARAELDEVRLASN
jgi:hypothetical protein